MKAIYHTRHLAVCLLMLSVIPARAQQHLSLDEAVSIGVRANHGVLIAVSQRDISRNNNNIGTAGFLPRIDLTVDYTRSVGEVDIRMITGLEYSRSNATTKAVGAGANLRWTVFDGMGMFVERERLQALEDIGDLRLRLAIEETVARITLAYCDVVRRRRMLNVLTEQVEVSRSRLMVAQTAFDTGSESELELLKARVDLNADSTALMRQRSSVTTAMSELNVLLARDASVAFGVDDEMVIGGLMQEDVLRKELTRNSSMLLAQRMRDVDSLEVGRNTARLWPTFQVKAGYNYSLNETDASAVSYNKYYGPSIGLSASFTLFNGFIDQHARENALINAAAGELRLRETRLQTEKRFLILWNEYITERVNAQLERGNVELARKSLVVAQEAYAVGNSSSLELREVQRNLLSAEQRLVDAQYAVIEREVGLKLLTGSVDVWN